MDRRGFLKLSVASLFGGSVANAKLTLHDVERFDPEERKELDALLSGESETEKLEKYVMEDPLKAPEKEEIQAILEEELHREEYTIDEEDRAAIRKFIGDDIYAKRGDAPGARRLRLYNPHTKESFSKVYYINGKYRKTVMNEIYYFLRDFRQNKSIKMDTELIDLIYRLQVSLSPTEPLLVVSGYRTKRTNRMLRRRSRGVAKYSLHIEGKATDLAPADGSLKKLRRLHRLAKRERIGGVGAYRRSRFIHVDTGKIRYWGRV